MELFTALATRASAGQLAEPGPTPEELLRIIEAAERAPDHVLDGDSRGRFADAVVAARVARPPAPTPEQLTLERDKVWRSPAMVVVGCSVQRDNPKVPEIEQVVAVGAAAENLFLAAHALGYGVMWKTGPAAYDPGVKAAVGLRPDDHIVGIMHLGTRVK